MFAFGLGHGELLVILLIVLLLFGGRLPDLTRSIGGGVTEFKKGIQDDELRDHFGRRWRLREYEQDEGEKPAGKLELVGRIILFVTTLLLIIGIVLYFFR